MIKTKTTVKSRLPFLSKEIITEGFEEKNSVELSKDRNGNYSWIIKIYGNDYEEIIEKIRQANEKMKTLFL